MKKSFIIFIAGLTLGLSMLFLLKLEKRSSIAPTVEMVSSTVTIKPTTVPIPTISTSKILSNDYHIFQTFNNCGPAALSMALSYYDINVSQQELGNDIRPNQHPKGISDDKSVTLDELAIKSKDYGLTPYHRPNGSVEIVKQFIANDIPVVARTWLKNGEDIGHYRVVKGYNETTQSFLQDDSLQGKNLWYSYDDFNALWEAFNFEYLVLIPQDKVLLASKILDEDVDEQKSWEKVVKISSEKFGKDQNNIYAGFNTAIAYSKTNQHQLAVEWFEKVENKLPRRMLWYQLDPILSYVSVKNYEKAESLINGILATENNAYAELFLIRAYMSQQQGRLLEAKSAYQQALRYNHNLLKFQTILPQQIVEEFARL